MRTSLLALLLFFATTANISAQENTVEDWSWKVDHFKRYGIWESVCDHRDEAGETLRRCYVTYVDVFSPRPKFAAAFVFVTPLGEDGLKYEFRFEPGTQIDADGFALHREGKPVWSYNPGNCPTMKCIFQSAEAEALAEAMSEPGALRFSMVDRHGQPQERFWDTEGFADALIDLRQQAAERDLL